MVYLENVSNEPCLILIVIDGLKVMVNEPSSVQDYIVKVGDTHACASVTHYISLLRLHCQTLRSLLLMLLMQRWGGVAC